ncbi:MAG: cyclic nucleotide-binding domain-containing protein [Deltaproteobacteria bacterium]|nr:cyclic nucleotide-binding domain-containing protein [Deltaproteobacteria bacterium]
MFINEVALFEGLAPDIMEEIVDICSEEHCAKDSVLFKKGEEADCLYILEEGAIRLVIENGGTISYALSGPGKVFGWSSMVEFGRYTASSICSTDIKVLKIEREELDKVFRLHPDVGLKVLKRLAGVISQRLSNAYRDLLSARKQDVIPSYG